MVRIGKRIFSWNSAKLRVGGFATEKATKVDWGEKINDELVRGMRRDGTPLGVTSGDYEADVLSIGFLVDEFYGNGAQQGIAQKLSVAAGTAGLSDVEFDVFLQMIEEQVGVVTVTFPVCRITAPKMSMARGPAGVEVDVGIRVIDPIVVNGIKLASVQRGLTI
jgi:hypothetical protein